jgi:hypothetical protein
MLPNLFLCYDKNLYFSGFYVATDLRVRLSHIWNSPEHFPLSHKLMVYYHEVFDGGNVSAERKRKITLLNLDMNITFIWTFTMRYLEHVTNINSGPFSLMFWQMEAYTIHRVNKMPKQWGWYKTNKRELFVKIPTNAQGSSWFLLIRSKFSTPTCFGI